MTTPVNFNTWDRIVRNAMQNAGLLQDGSDPTGEQYAKYFTRLQDLINLRLTGGLKMWLWIDQSVPLTAGKTVYVIGPGGDVNVVRPLDVEMGYYLDTSNNRRPLIPLSWDEYIRLSNVVQQGAINSYFVDKQATKYNVSMWLTPDTQAATGTVHLVLKQQIAQPVALTDAMSFPLEWFMYLHWGLADEICTGQPQAIMDRCQQRAMAYLETLEGFDVETASTMFQPDPRAIYNVGGFR